MNHRVVPLDPTEPSTQEEAAAVLRQAYEQEAALIGVDAGKFPPLRRTAQALIPVDAIVRAVYSPALAGLIVARRDETEGLWIDALGVHPDHLRRGLARTLLDHLLQEYPDRPAWVDTAAANTPALMLYQGCGFVAVEHWRSEDRIDKVRLRLDPT